MPIDNYSNNVFINCPFDPQYLPLLHAIIFAVFDCGFIVRITSECPDSSRVRVNKIMDIISECKYGIHDISHTECDGTDGLPRFNMPFELGLFIAAKHFGDDRQQNKMCVICDREQYRYQKFLSDISGQDIMEYGNNPEGVISMVRGWLAKASRRQRIPGGTIIHERYSTFAEELPEICHEVNINENEITLVEYCDFVSNWLMENTL